MNGLQEMSKYQTTPVALFDGLSLNLNVISL